MKFFLFTAIIFIAMNSYAQESLPVIKSLQNKFKTIEDFKSSFKQTASGSFSENDLILSGTFNYKKKNKFKVEIKNIILISDGSSVWNYDKKLNRVVINTIDENQTFLNLDDIINNYPVQCIANIDKDIAEPNFIIVNLTPKDNSLEFESAKLWIDKNYILNKIQITDSSGSKYFIELSNIKLNQNLSDDEFGFIIPEGCKVIDFR